MGLKRFLALGLQLKLAVKFQSKLMQNTLMFIVDVFPKFAIGSECKLIPNASLTYKLSRTPRRHLLRSIIQNPTISSFDINQGQVGGKEYRNGWFFSLAFLPWTFSGEYAITSDKWVRHIKKKLGVGSQKHHLTYAKYSCSLFSLLLGLQNSICLFVCLYSDVNKLNWSLFVASKYS